MHDVFVVEIGNSFLSNNQHCHLSLSLSSSFSLYPFISLSLYLSALCFSKLILGRESAGVEEVWRIPLGKNTHDKNTHVKNTHDKNTNQNAKRIDRYKSVRDTPRHHAYTDYRQTSSTRCQEDWHWCMPAYEEPQRTTAHVLPAFRQQSLTCSPMFPVGVPPSLPLCPVASQLCVLAVGGDWGSGWPLLPWRRHRGGILGGWHISCRRHVIRSLKVRERERFRCRRRERFRCGRGDGERDSGVEEETEREIQVWKRRRRERFRCGRREIQVWTEGHPAFVFIYYCVCVLYTVCQ